MQDGMLPSDMEALIMQINGAELQKVTIMSPPAKTEYINDTLFDPTGMRVVVTVSGFELEVTDYSWSPKTVASETSEIIVSYTMDGVTKTAIQPLTVFTVDPVLENNSWETIAAISAKGLAGDIWRIGDTKELVTSNDIPWTCAIIGFDHDDLSSTDARYGDSTYNSGTGKAGITFQPINAHKGSALKIDSGSTKKNWSTCSLRNSNLASIKTKLPDDLEAVMRTVTKKSWDDHTETLISTDDQLFLLALAEVMPDQYPYYSNVGGQEYHVQTLKENKKAEGSQYEYYAAGNTRIKSDLKWWLRSNSTNTQSNMQWWEITEKGYAYAALQGSATAYICAAFCV
jgi:hypothetical protein